MYQKLTVLNTGVLGHGYTESLWVFSDTELVCTKPFSFMRILIRRKKTGIATITIKKAISRKKNAYFINRLQIRKIQRKKTPIILKKITKKKKITITTKQNKKPPKHPQNRTK